MIKFRIIRQMFNYNMTPGGVAAALGMTEITMRRHLSQECGESFHAVKTAVRIRMIENLVGEGKTTDCITHEIGFAYNNNTRAFVKRYMGMPLHKYRGAYGNRKREGTTRGYGLDERKRDSQKA